MIKVNLLNNIKSSKLELFNTEKYTVGVELENHEALMLRSAKIHDMVFGNELLCIARAGAGYNNIPVDRCADEGIVVFNTPGANSGAVKELIICSLFLASRDIVGGMRASIYNAMPIEGTQKLAAFMREFEAKNK